MPPPHSAPDVFLCLLRDLWLSARGFEHRFDHQIATGKIGSISGRVDQARISSALLWLIWPRLTFFYPAAFAVGLAHCRRLPAIRLSAPPEYPLLAVAPGNAGAHHAGTDYRHLADFGLGDIFRRLPPALISFNWNQKLPIMFWRSGRLPV